MAKTKTDHTKLALQRLALDEEVQEHLGNAVVQLREAWRRAAHRPPARAVEDKQLYARIRQAAISLARALRLLAPEPAPPKRRGRKLVAVLPLAPGAAFRVPRLWRGSVADPVEVHPRATQTPVATAPP